MPDIVGKLKVLLVSFGCVNVILCLIGLAIFGGFGGTGTFNFVTTQRMNKHLEKYHVRPENKHPRGKHNSFIFYQLDFSPDLKV